MANNFLLWPKAQGWRPITKLPETALYAKALECILRPTVVRMYQTYKKMRMSIN